METRNTYALTLVILFLVGIFTVGTIFLLSEKQEKDIIENRMLAKKPEIRSHPLDSFPKAFENYFNDHFPYRRDIIHKHSFYSLLLFDISTVTEDVIIGKDGWLFNAGQNLDFYNGATQSSPEEIKRMVAGMKQRVAYCKQKGIEVYFVLLPQKHSIYPEYLPNNRITIYNKKDQGDQLKEAIEKEKSIHFIDITDSLLNYKNKGRLFQKTDNHWTDLGAFYGARITKNRIKKDFPDLDMPDENSYKIVTKNTPGGNLAAKLSLTEELPEQYIYFQKQFESKATAGSTRDYPLPDDFGIPDEYQIVRKNPIASPYKALFIRDSYAVNQIEFWEECFEESVFIWDAWEYGFNKEIIDQEQPDIVVYQMLEKLIPNLLKSIDKEHISSTTVK